MKIRALILSLLANYYFAASRKGLPDLIVAAGATVSLGSAG
jgi:hypothetical protein